MSLPQLKAADTQEVKIYMPSCPEAKRKFLPLAISLYKHKSLEGARGIDGGEDIPFAASWNAPMLPIDLTRCRMVFEGNAELSYEVMLQSSEFVNYLIDVLLTYQRTRCVDFPKAFYRKLLRLDE